MTPTTPRSSSIRPAKTPVLREVLQSTDFRIGLSHAINRPEVATVVYLEQGEPWEVAPLPDGPFYDEELAKQYTEFDLDLANEHLDRAGLDQRGGDGFRLRPDGERLSFRVISPGDDPTWLGMGSVVHIGRQRR